MKTTAIILAMLVMCATVLAQPVDPRRSISVVGEAEAAIAPDKASVVIGVETEGADVLTIKAENDKRVKAMMSALKTIGIPDKDIQTSDLQIQPQYNWKEGRREFVKYTMRNVVTIVVRDLSKLEKVINAGVAGGVNLLDNINFSASNAKAIRDSLRIEAVKNGKAKATELVAAVGGTVGKVLSIEEVGGNSAPIPMYKAEMMRASGVSEDTSTPVSAGQLVLHVTVNLKFGIE